MNLFNVRLDIFKSFFFDYIVLAYLLYSKINLIVIFINVFENMFINFDVNVDFHIDMSVIFDRQIKIIKHYLTICFKFIF